MTSDPDFFTNAGTKERQIYDKGSFLEERAKGFFMYDLYQVDASFAEFSCSIHMDPAHFSVLSDGKAFISGSGKIKIS